MVVYRFILDDETYETNSSEKLYSNLKDALKQYYKTKRYCFKHFKNRVIRTEEQKCYPMDKLGNCIYFLAEIEDRKRDLYPIVEDFTCKIITQLIQ